MSAVQGETLTFKWVLILRASVHWPAQIVMGGSYLDAFWVQLYEHWRQRASSKMAASCTFQLTVQSYFITIFMNEQHVWTRTNTRSLCTSNTCPLQLKRSRTDTYTHIHDSKIIIIYFFIPVYPGQQIFLHIKNLSELLSWTLTEPLLRSSLSPLLTKKIDYRSHVGGRIWI